MAAASPTVSSPPYSTASPSNAPEVKRVGTHNGSFHCDEALGCFMIRLTSKFCNAHIVRTRDPQVLEDLDAVLDVGGIYDPIRDRYDHHQKGFEEVFGYGFSTKLSSAGLVYKVVLFEHAIILTDRMEICFPLCPIWYAGMAWELE